MNRLALAQLLRLPNVFTSFADILMAAAAGSALCGTWPDPATLAAGLGASGLLYLAGMVSNDLFDREEDARARPFRPIPSGRVTLRTALLIAAALFALGLGSAALAGRIEASADSPLAVAACLAALILLYNSWLKHTSLGPVAMGGCRSLNVLLGCALAADPAALPPGLRLHLAAVVGVYIAGVTAFARTEEADSRRRALLAAALVMLAALIAAVALAAQEPRTPPFRPYPYLLTLWAVGVGGPVAAAVSRPEPKPVQRAVKRCIFGLVALDAALAAAFVGWPGLAVLLLLPPALWLGRRVYST